MTRFVPPAALAAIFLLTASLSIHAEQQPGTPAEQKQDSGAKDQKPPPEPKVWTSRHQVRIGGKALEYEATTGTLVRGIASSGEERLEHVLADVG